MKKVIMSAEHKKILDDTANIIFDEIAQNLCLAKLTLTVSSTDKVIDLKEKIKKSNELVSKSIKLLRKVGESINDIKK